jgi:hypothetical protein
MVSFCRYFGEASFLHTLGLTLKMEALRSSEVFVFTSLHGVTFYIHLIPYQQHCD